MNSEDLRKKVYEACQSGHSWKSISTNFEVPKTSCRRVVEQLNSPTKESHKPNLKTKGNN